MYYRNSDLSLNRYFTKFKEKYAGRLQRPGLIESIDEFVGYYDFENGFLYFECPSCDEFYMMRCSCHSRMCPSCRKKTKAQANSLLI